MSDKISRVGVRVPGMISNRQLVKSQYFTKEYITEMRNAFVLLFFLIRGYENEILTGFDLNCFQHEYS